MATWRILLAGILLPLGAAVPSGLQPAPFARVEIATAKTSIYVGTVSLIVQPLRRRGPVYLARYQARVFPFFFYDEEGSLQITVSDPALRRLTSGHPIEFSGQAVRDDGAIRRVEGRAVPTDRRSGRIKVRVFLSRHIALTFHSSYRFGD